jgi:hypothetical protein
VEPFRLWGLCTAGVFILSLIGGGFMLLVIWLIVSVEIAIVLGTGLRGWLGIPDHRNQAPRHRRTELVDQDLELMEPGMMEPSTQSAHSG